MTLDLKKIKSGDTEIGVGKHPYSNDILVVIEDKMGRNWIKISKHEANRLLENLKESISYL